ncbi:beach domain-containing protein [Anaeramoeba ignava]|uniref:Beach domain-containing protein n=1 Tax=Anaeramoeba ignava TaxID=1746090 RepID=A0A9Q0LU41_ANAIG|nr:beach domain-containing protein [Anaeramoeba ignava]
MSRWFKNLIKKKNKDKDKDKEKEEKEKNLKKNNEDQNTQNIASKLLNLQKIQEIRQLWNEFSQLNDEDSKQNLLNQIVPTFYEYFYTEENKNSIKEFGDTRNFSFVIAKYFINLLIKLTKEINSSDPNLLSKIINFPINHQNNLYYFQLSATLLLLSQQEINIEFLLNSKLTSNLLNFLKLFSQFDLNQISYEENNNQEKNENRNETENDFILLFVDILQENSKNQKSIDQLIQSDTLIILFEIINSNSNKNYLIKKLQNVSQLILLQFMNENLIFYIQTKNIIKIQLETLSETSKLRYKLFGKIVADMLHNKSTSISDLESIIKNISSLVFCGDFNIKSIFDQEKEINTNFSIQNTDALQILSNIFLLSANSSFKKLSLFTLQQLFLILQKNPYNYYVMSQSKVIELVLAKFPLYENEIQVDLLKIIKFVASSLQITPKLELEILIQLFKNKPKIEVVQLITNLFKDLISSKNEFKTILFQFGLFNSIYTYIQKEISQHKKHKSKKKSQSKNLIIFYIQTIEFFVNDNLENMNLLYEKKGINLLFELIKLKDYQQLTLSLIESLAIQDKAQKLDIIKLILDEISSMKITQLSLYKAFLICLTSIFKQNQTSQVHFQKIQGYEIIFNKILPESLVKIQNIEAQNQFLQNLFQMIICSLSDSKINQIHFHHIYTHEKLVNSITRSGNFHSLLKNSQKYHLFCLLLDLSILSNELLHTNNTLIPDSSKLKIVLPHPIMVVVDLMKDFAVNYQIQIFLKLKIITIGNWFNQQQINSVEISTLLMKKYQEFLFDEESLLHPVLTNFFQIIQASNSSIKEFRKFFRLFKKNKNIPNSILSIFKSMIHDGNQPSFIEFDLQESSNAKLSLEYSNDKSWPPSSSYSLSFWIYFDSLSEFSINLFRVFSSKNQLEIIFSISNGKLSITSSSNSSISFDKFQFKENHWYHAVIVHSKHKFYQSSITLFVDGSSKQICKINYPNSIQSPFKFVIGNENISENPPHIKWKLGSCFLYESALSLQDIQKIFLLGPNYSGSFINPFSQFTNFQIVNNYIVDNLFKNGENFEDIMKQLDLSIASIPINFLKQSLSIQNLAVLNGKPYGILSGNVNVFLSKGAIMQISKIRGPIICFLLFEKITTEIHFQQIFAILVNLINLNYTNLKEFERMNGYKIMSHFLKENSHFINVNIINSLFELIGTQEDANISSLIKNLGIIEIVCFDQEIWSKTSNLVQEYFFAKFQTFIPIDNKNQDFNINQLRKLRFVKYLFKLLREEIFDDSVINKIVSLLDLIFDHSLLSDEFSLFQTFITSTLNYKQEKSDPENTKFQNIFAKIHGLLLDMIFGLIVRNKNKENNHELIVKILSPSFVLSIIEHSKALSTKIKALKLTTALLLMYPLFFQKFKQNYGFPILTLILSKIEQKSIIYYYLFCLLFGVSEVLDKENFEVKETNFKEVLLNNSSIFKKTSQIYCSEAFFLILTLLRESQRKCINEELKFHEEYQKKRKLRRESKHRKSKRRSKKKKEQRKKENLNQKEIENQNQNQNQNQKENEKENENFIPIEIQNQIQNEIQNEKENENETKSSKFKISKTLPSFFRKVRRKTITKNAENEIPKVKNEEVYVFPKIKKRRSKRRQSETKSITQRSHISSYSKKLPKILQLQIQQQNEIIKFLISFFNNYPNFRDTFKKLEFIEALVEIIFINYSEIQMEVDESLNNNNNQSKEDSPQTERDMREKERQWEFSFLLQE